MPKGVPNKRYTPEFKKLVVETMQKEKLSYSLAVLADTLTTKGKILSFLQNSGVAPVENQL